MVKMQVTLHSNTFVHIKYFIRWLELLFYHLIVKKYYINNFFVIPKFWDWDAANPGIRDWRKWPTSWDTRIAITSCLLWQTKWHWFNHEAKPDHGLTLATVCIHTVLHIHKNCQSWFSVTKNCTGTKYDQIKSEGSALRLASSS